MEHSKLEMLLGKLLRLIAGFISPAVHQGCRLWWYQPEEPDGFEEFAKSLKKTN